MSLWLDPQKGAVTVRIRDRFGDYPYFLHSFEQYTEFRMPDVVTVRWVPLEEVLEPLQASDAGEEAQHNEFIDYVTEIMRDGEDIPPVLLEDGAVFDGRHRAWAAHQLGLERAPVVDVTEFWGSSPGRRDVKL